MNTKKKLLAMLGTLALVSYAVTGLAAGMAYGRSQAPAPLEGTWLVRIQPYVCSTGTDVPVPAVLSYLTFGAGGTLLESTSNPAFEPGQRGPGHGFWERTGRTSYRAVLQAYVLFDSTLTTRYKRGYQRIDQGIEFHDDDHWTSNATVQFFVPPSTTPVPPSGCARATATRME
jgi:hypothetical protein